MLGTSITAFMRNNFSHWSWILHHSISTLDFQSEGFQQSALYSAFSRHRFHQSTDILHTQVTPPSADPKTWHHFWNRNHLIKHHWLSPSHNIIDSASQIGPRITFLAVFEILSKSACWLAWFKNFFFWIWGLIFGYVFRLGKTRLHEFFQIYRPINTSGPPMWSFNGNFNGKMAKNRFLAIKSSRSVLQPSSYHCWATFL